MFQSKHLLYRPSVHLSEQAQPEIALAALALALGLYMAADGLERRDKSGASDLQRGRLEADHPGFVLDPPSHAAPDHTHRLALGAVDERARVAPCSKGSFLIDRGENNTF